jgi:hypothetical protein
MAVAGGAAASASKAPKTTTEKSGTTAQSTGPWQPQQEFVYQTLEDGQSNYEEAKARGTYSGDLSAGMNDTTRAGLTAATDYATGTGATLAANAATNAGTLMGATDGFTRTAASLAGNGAGPANATAQGVLTRAANGEALAGPNAARTSGLAGQMGALSTAQALTDRANGDPAARALATGGAFAENPTVQGQIDAANRDAARTYSEATLPGLNARASAGGNVNSARAGAAEAVAARGLADRTADTSAAIRSNAFDQGVGASLTGNAQNNALALGANAQAATTAGALSGVGETQRQFDTSTALGAATALGTQDTANRALEANTRLAANAQQGQAATAGFDAATTAGALSDANSTRQVLAGSALQQEEQRANDEAYERWNREYAQKQAQTTGYQGIVANQVYGSQVNGTTTGTEVVTGPAPPGVLQGALAGGAAGMGMMTGTGALSGAMAPTGGAENTAGGGALKPR